MRILRTGDKNVESNQLPGSFELIELNLIDPSIRTKDGLKRPKKYSIMLPYSELSIFEDLYSNCLSGTLIMADAGGIRTEFPIRGDEEIEVIFRSMNTPIANHLKLRVTGISAIDKIDDTIEIYTLMLTSATAIQSEKKKISKSFAGIQHKAHHIIQEICEKYLGLKNERKVEEKILGDYKYKDKSIDNNYYRIESTTGHTEKYVAPFISPFHIINNICKRSINSSGSLFFFFEDFSCFRFINMEENSKIKKKKPPVRNFIYRPRDTLDETTETRQMNWSIIKSYTVKKRFNVLDNMAKGMYSSEVTFLDLEKRNVTSKRYFYQEDGAEYNHTSDGFLLTSKNSDLIHDSRFESPATVQSIVPFHSGDAQSQDYTLHIQEFFQRRMSMEAQLNGIVLEVEIAGDSTGDISIGEFVQLSLLTVAKDDTQAVVADKELSGKYMITRIRHTISKADNSYTMYLELVSDTIFTEYDPNPEKESKDIEPISIPVNDQEIELAADQVTVSTSKKANLDVDYRHEIDRKRRLMSLGQTLIEEEIRNVKSQKL